MFLMFYDVLWVRDLKRPYFDDACFTIWVACVQRISKPFITVYSATVAFQKPLWLNSVSLFDHQNT